MISCLIASFVGASVIGNGLILLLSIAKWHDLLNSQLPVYDGGCMMVTGRPHRIF
jgi:hypothetical protein